MSESWTPDEHQPDDEPALPPIGFLAQLMRPRSPEEIAQIKDDQERNVALGNLAWEGLPRYDPTQTYICPSCGGTKMHLGYCINPRGEPNDHLSEAGTREHLHVGCKRCGFVRLMRTMTDTRPEPRGSEITG